MPGPIAFPFRTGYNVRLKSKQVCCSMLVTTLPYIRQVFFANAVTNLEMKDDNSSDQVRLVSSSPRKCSDINDGRCIQQSLHYPKEW